MNEAQLVALGIATIGSENVITVLRTDGGFAFI